MIYVLSRRSETRPFSNCDMFSVPLLMEGMNPTTSVTAKLRRYIGYLIKGTISDKKYLRITLEIKKKHLSTTTCTMHFFSNNDIFWHKSGTSNNFIPWALPLRAACFSPW